jgi:hypothetical protein
MALAEGALADLERALPAGHADIGAAQAELERIRTAAGAGDERHAAASAIPRR